ncbi:redox-sensitive transcriptional activator SoxR [Janibacter melonis]|uniref:redox-sensitive transcriptional activator SoxR n=1 Tax=Janibacter melonis TaxID=262209 RepID=UPI00174847BD|nr:redox-sensitive transcriptional activator SoxR [Janibacter melonis]
MDQRHKDDLLPVGEIAHRAGISVPTVRFYEERGLIGSTRTAGNQRRFARHTLRRIAYVRAAQRFGLSLAEIREALDTLPADRAPTKGDWARLSRRWHDVLQERIEALERLRDTTDGCIGCGCLSTTRCPIYNTDDELAATGSGARRWPDALREG